MADWPKFCFGEEEEFHKIPLANFTESMKPET